MCGEPASDEQYFTTLGQSLIDQAFERYTELQHEQPRDDEIRTCGFMAVPGARNCDKPAEHHGLIFDEDLVLKATAYSCGDHLAAMRLSSHLEHDLESACGLPGSRVEWDNGLSWCWLPDITAVLLANAAVEVRA